MRSISLILSLVALAAAAPIDPHSNLDIKAIAEPIHVNGRAAPAIYAVIDDPTRVAKRSVPVIEFELESLNSIRV
ncbi:hypothetical protein P280DRAFT_109390 [Massarina eburnea CBS 473.64]|uniref:Uncharacterized protein n=1 Tax=Massarina eburnea CBS 473.64 TaxID=1395130 RepID=A0A6A6RR62_9PLEO|nr:hypothetical protein P280DRAFT_109390 [Massarina eburnea CBS 473.64]